MGDRVDGSEAKLGSLWALRSEFWSTVFRVAPEAASDLASKEEGKPLRELDRATTAAVESAKPWHLALPKQIPTTPEDGETESAFRKRKARLEQKWTEFFAEDDSRGRAARDQAAAADAVYRKALSAWADRWHLTSLRSDPWCLQIAEENLLVWLDSHELRDGRVPVAPVMHLGTPPPSPIAWHESPQQVHERFEAAEAEHRRRNLIDPDLDRFLTGPGQATPDARRDLEMLALYQVRGKSYRDLATQFGCSSRTAREHVKAWAKRIGIGLAKHPPGRKASSPV